MGMYKNRVDKDIHFLKKTSFIYQKPLIKHTSNEYMKYLIKMEKYYMLRTISYSLKKGYFFL